MEQGTPGARVQSARKRRGMTQRELAEASGLSLPAVKKIEQGACGSMRLETVRGLAVALGVPTSALRGDEPDAPEPGQESVQRWEPVRRAIGGEFDGGEPAEEPTVEGLRSAFGSVTGFQPGPERMGATSGAVKCTARRSRRRLFTGMSTLTHRRLDCPRPPAAHARPAFHRSFRRADCPAAGRGR
jgi:transcriptional regulator with XRE-family HTH domain